MARSPNDDPRYNIQHAWNYHTEAAENSASGAMNERIQPSISSNSGVINDNSAYVNANFANNVFLNKQPYSGDAALNNDENISFNNMSNVPRINCQNYANAMFNLGNGQLLRVLYDKNNPHFVCPYELFNNHQGTHDTPLQNIQPSHIYNLNENNQAETPLMKQNNSYIQENIAQSNIPTSNFLKEVLGNWEPNSSGTYSPFGQNYPLNHPDSPNINNIMPSTSVMESPLTQTIKIENSPKRNEHSPLADTSTKKRIVAEVKPMRPTYSDILAKNSKNNSPMEAIRRVKPVVSPDAKPKANLKLDKSNTNVKNINDENKIKMEKKHHSHISSGSESGDIVNDDREVRQKPNKKSKNKRGSMPRKWSSLDDVTNEEDAVYTDSQSQFVFIKANDEKPSKKDKKGRAKDSKNDFSAVDFELNDEDDKSQFVFQESQGETKSKKKKDRTTQKSKPQDKKKTAQVKRKTKPGYLGLAQNYLEHWMEVTCKAGVWFLFLLSDICQMSAHLSFDLCTSMFTQTYVSSQAVWRSCKDWIYKIKDNKYLMWIDRKLGHTRLGFWRKLKWFKKEVDTDNNSEDSKLNANIPLPATGDEAMKRLLACKGKDPYSILGVNVNCTDEEIKRYYRRQAFLVHPDKNHQPGAEEAFKILQHAFDLIGEPERREAFARRTLESRHAEAAWSELSQLLAQLHDKMEFAHNTIRCTNCGRRHKRVLTDRPCYAARYCAQCKIRHSAKEGDIWAESSMMGLLIMYYACMDGAVYQITQWASCQKKNLKQLRPDCHVVQYRIVLGSKAHAQDVNQTPNAGHDPNLEEFLNNLYNKSGVPPNGSNKPQNDAGDAKKRRNKKPKA